MTRNVRDLRDIINVSRLSIRGDEEQFDRFSSDDEDELCLKENEDLQEYISSRPSSAMAFASNFGTLTSTQTADAKPPSVTSVQQLYTIRKHASKMNRPFTAPNHRVENELNQNKGRMTVPLLSNNEKLPFPSKYTPIPPIIKKGGKSDLRFRHNKPKEKMNFDHLFEYLDSTIVNDWLEECNQNMEDLTQFTLAGKNFVEFAEFFLSNVKYTDYCCLLDLEFSIIVDRLKYGLHAGYNISLVTDNDLRQLASSVLPEYPTYLKDKDRGINYLLDMFLIISSSKKERYRALLKSMNCHTINKHFIQWLLAIRAHGLLSFLTGVLRFYLDSQQDSVSCGVNRVKCFGYDYTDTSFEALYRSWVLWAIRDQHLKVVDYFFQNKDIDLLSLRDDKKRNLLFVAMEADNKEAMYYLCQIKKSFVTEVADNGNTPLMYAVNKNDINAAKFLLEMGANVNRWNEQADGATALHLAVLLGSKKMVQLLLEVGADKTVCMGVPASTTPYKLAEQCGHGELIDLLKSK